VYVFILMIELMVF